MKVAFITGVTAMVKQIITDATPKQFYSKHFQPHRPLGGRDLLLKSVFLF